MAVLGRTDCPGLILWKPSKAVTLLQYKQPQESGTGAGCVSISSSSCTGKWHWLWSCNIYALCFFEKWFILNHFYSIRTAYFRHSVQKQTKDKSILDPQIFYSKWTMKLFTLSVKGNGMLQFHIHINSDEDKGNGGICKVEGSEMGREKDRNEFFQRLKKNVSC